MVKTDTGCRVTYLFVWLSSVYVDFNKLLLTAAFQY